MFMFVGDNIYCLLDCIIIVSNREDKKKKAAQDRTTTNYDLSSKTYLTPCECNIN